MGYVSRVVNLSYIFSGTLHSIALFHFAAQWLIIHNYEQNDFFKQVERSSSFPIATR